MEASEQFDDAETMEKYKTAGRIATETVAKLVDMCIPGAKLVELNTSGDSYVEEKLAKFYRKQLKNGKGLAFPTCVSVNHVAGYYRSTDPSEEVKEGDVVKIEVGVHIDGFPAALCFTHLVSDEKLPLDDPRARVMQAVVEAAKGSMDNVKVGGSNIAFVEGISATAKKYECNLLVADAKNVHAPSVISYQVSQNVLDGQNDDEDEDIHKLILSRRNETYDFELRENEFEENEVYAIDIGMSTGSGKIAPVDRGTTIFKRDPTTKYLLKLRAARETLNMFNGKSFPIDLSGKINARTRLGLKECLEHRLVEPYPVLEERPGEFVARIMYTVVIRKKSRSNKSGQTLVAALSSAKEMEKIGE